MPGHKRASDSHPAQHRLGQLLAHQATNADRRRLTLPTHGAERIRELRAADDL